LNSTFSVGPPTHPDEVSLSACINAPEVVSVYPYPSITGQQNASLMKSATSFEIGADPVRITSTLPPNIARTFEKISESQQA